MSIELFFRGCCCRRRRRRQRRQHRVAARQSDVLQKSFVHGSDGRCFPWSVGRLAFFVAHKMYVARWQRQHHWSITHSNKHRAISTAKTWPFFLLLLLLLPRLSLSAIHAWIVLPFNWQRNWSFFDGHRQNEWFRSVRFFSAVVHYPGSGSRNGQFDLFLYVSIGSVHMQSNCACQRWMQIVIECRETSI